MPFPLFCYMAIGIQQLWLNDFLWSMNPMTWPALQASSKK